MTKFWELLQESVILQAFLTAAIWGVTVYLLATGQEVPDELNTAAILILGFYFGAKQNQLTSQIRK